MSQSTKLTAGERHLMYLLDRDKDTQGWTKVSAAVWPHVAALPTELRELNSFGTHARLTDKGEVVLRYR